MYAKVNDILDTPQNVYNRETKCLFSSYILMKNTIYYYLVISQGCLVIIFGY